ncbi:hypothetical protein [Nostoc sphaeroides]|uniref:Uncharacterized protein n=1 Tax=Nostoc sphaeroides CCNUC1 TaxID=2653204 RepID=A0A5P8WH97_9NOSO|nr:hypothetical protein [Nostoc sphaeroides]MCC5633061.1 hypothetical protein [Nostoc sphaeroides CHAB 2801]QFS51536.1 hypothetical protein GXM_09030 [Nostoc sphaeroides CCNUC1]
MSSHEPDALNDLFAKIGLYIDWQYSDFLKRVLEYKLVSISTLYDLLQEQGYTIELESLRRYFNSNKQSSRFPPKEFVKVFCKCLDLTCEQEAILLILWGRMKVIRKLERKFQTGKLKM